jgi:hypothetical protein
MSPSRPTSRRTIIGVVVGTIVMTAAVLALLTAGGGVEALPQATAGAKKPSSLARCGFKVAGIDALESAVGRVQPDSVICLADGSYGAVELSGDGGGRVSVRPVHPGQATISGATLEGEQLTLAGFDVTGEVTIEPGSSGMTISYNRITGGYMGINAGPTTDTNISDTTIKGNRLVGPFGEDALRINRYHDSADSDPYGILIEGNEITGVRENGAHSDCLQSVWGGDGLYFRRNYLHDNRCQGFFVKDQPEAVSRIVLAQNLMVRNAAPCEPPESGCGAPSIVQIFGPIAGLRLIHNTIWTAGNRSPVALREGPFGTTALESNVLFRTWSDWTGGFSGFVDHSDLYCQWEGTLPRPSASNRRSCSPRFRNAADDDYRLRHGDAGISWSPTAQRYGFRALP